MTKAKRRTTKKRAKRQAKKKSSKTTAKRKPKKSTKIETPNNTGFVHLEHCMLQAPAFDELSITAVAVLVHGLRQLQMEGNGKLQFGRPFFERIGIDKDRGYKAVEKLVQAGYLVLTRDRGKLTGGSQPRLYAFTWLGIDSTWRTHRGAPKSDVPLRTYLRGWDPKGTNERRKQFIAASSQPEPNRESVARAARRARAHEESSSGRPIRKKRTKKNGHASDKAGRKSGPVSEKTGSGMDSRPRKPEQPRTSDRKNRGTNIEEDLLQRGVSLKGHTPTSSRSPAGGGAAGGQAPARTTAAAAGQSQVAPRAPSAKDRQQMRVLTKMLRHHVQNPGDEIRKAAKWWRPKDDVASAKPEYFAELVGGLSLEAAYGFCGRLEPGLQTRIDLMHGAFRDWWPHVTADFLLSTDEDAA